MKLVQWVRFIWDLDKLPTLEMALPWHYSFTPATADDEKEVRLVIRRSFAHDTSWGDAFHEIEGMLDGWLVMRLIRIRLASVSPCVTACA